LLLADASVPIHEAVLLQPLIEQVAGDHGLEGCLPRPQMDGFKGRAFLRQGQSDVQAASP
jgi:hypothetical protein